MSENEDVIRCPYCDSTNVERFNYDPPPDEVIVMNHRCRECGEEFEWY